MYSLFKGIVIVIPRIIPNITYTHTDQHGLIDISHPKVPSIYAIPPNVMFFNFMIVIFIQTVLPPYLWAEQFQEGLYNCQEDIFLPENITEAISKH